jgi:hypothetical protein
MILNGSTVWPHVQAGRSTSALAVSPDLGSLTTDAVTEIARAQGMDFATTVLYQCVLQSERFGPAVESVLQGPDRWVNSRRSPLLAVVPGAFHAENMDTGADGRRFLEIADAHGFRSRAIATHSFGSLRQNAQIIAEWLEKHTREEVILIALSKGAAEIFYLLRNGHTDLFRNVAAIVNVSGMVFGTRLVDWVAERTLPLLYVRGLMWWKNYDYENLLELRHSEINGALGKMPVRMINVIGFPLEAHLSSAMARRQYRRLRPYGPNDGGGIVLADALRFPGLLFPIWGGDHYMRHPDHLPSCMGQLLCAAADSARLPPER